MTENTSGKVINMEKYAKGDAMNAPSRPYELLYVCRDRMAEHLARSLHAMMERTDDTLFSMAEKAESNAIQSTYFDAMREVRIKRKEMEDRFKSHFLNECNNIIQRDSARTHMQLSLNDQDIGMSLIDHDEMEESLAVTNMVLKANNYCREELSHLNQRIGILLDNADLKNEGSPLGPVVVANSFRKSCEVLEVDIKVKLIVLKLFEKKVIEGLQPIYHDINQYLINNNVLPKITLRAKRNPISGAGMAGWIGPSVTTQASQENYYGAHGLPADEQDLFSVFRQFYSTGNANSGVPASSGQAVVSADLLNALTMIQQQQYMGIGDTEVTLDASSIRQGSANILRNVKAGGYADNLGHLDDMTIEIVAMLFDYIFEDKDVPVAMKVLIGQLQIPVLKVALIDRSLFAKKSHPARRLVNELARSTIGWHAENCQEDELYNRIQDIVGRIQREFEDDVDLFARLHEEFKQYLEDLDKKTEENVEESARLLKGREKLMLSKAAVQNEIDRRINNDEINKLVRVFILHQWKNLLLVVHVTEGEESQAWKRDLSTMDDLIWSVLPKKTKEDKAILLNMLPDMLSRLSAGMAMLSLPDDIQEQFLTRLASYHGKAINEDSRHAEELMEQEIVKQGSEEHILFVAKEPGQEQMQSSGQSGIPPVEELLVDEAIQEDATSENVLLDLSSGSHEEILKLVASGHLDVEEITLSGDEEIINHQANDLHTKMVQEMSLGTWVEFTQSDGARVRERLSWISQVTGVYLFTNRQGKKTSEKRLHELASEFRSGTAQLIEEVPLFDKAVSGLMHSIRSQTGR